MIGTVLNERFRVERHLARQGMVDVYEGLDLDVGQLVWVKRLGDPLNQNLDFIENWRAQLLSLQAVDEDELPRIYAFGRTPQEELYQVEEAPQGVPLQRYLAAAATSDIEEAVYIGAAAARGVGLAHHEGIAHGGLSPDFIYMRGGTATAGELFITGWESGEIINALRNDGEPLPGKFKRYLAPEQLRSPAPPATPTTDVYALGAILYELLTGSLPSAARPGETAAALTPPRRFDPTIPRAVEEVLLRALSPEPALRQPNGQSLARALLQALNASEVEAPLPRSRPPVVTERVERVTIRRPTWPAWLPWALLGMLMLVCLLTAAGLLLWDRREPTELAVAADEVSVVPRLAGPPYIPYNNAVELAWNEGFVVSIAGFHDDPALPAGAIVSQCPAPGSPASAVLTQCESPGTVPLSERVILVEVNSLPDPMVLRVVPDLYGQSEADARAALEAGALRLGSRREAYDLLLPAGRVIEQNPRRGLAVLPGTPVDLIVSAGPPPDEEGLLSAPLPTQPAVVPIPEATTPPLAVVSPTPLLEPSPTPFSPPPPPVEPVEGEVEPVEGEITPIEAAPGQTVLLEDDFEQGDALGWQVEEAPGQSSAIEGGAFQVQLTEPAQFWEAFTGRLFTDFTYRGVVTLEEGALDRESGAGILFRAQNPEQYYFFEVNPLGEFRLRARDGEAWTPLLDWQTSEAVLPAGAPNILAVEAIGERLTLFVNDTQVASLDTPPELTFLSGDVGLGAESATEPLSATFDNVLVTR